MKKKILLITIIQFVVFMAFSQDSFKPETSIGIKIGGNISSVIFDPTISQNNNYGFIGGLSFEHIEEKSLGIQIEVNYMQAGWNENLDSTNIYSRRLNYIVLPIMTHFNFGKNKTRLFINIGPYISYLISENESIDIIREDEEEDYYRTKITNRAEFGLCFGLGFTQYTSIGIFQIEGRGNVSLSNIFKNTVETPFDSSANLTVELALSYFFDCKIIRKAIFRKQ